MFAINYNYDKHKIKCQTFEAEKLVTPVIN